MTRTPQPRSIEVPRSACSTVRLPEGFPRPRLFAGWGPELGR